MKISPTIKERFEARVERDANGCLIWTGFVNPRTGYGLMSIATGISRGPHHVAWFLHHGHWPERLRHTCDNPICCEISHLLTGTQQQNIDDKVARNRQAKGQKHGMAKLNDDERDELRQLRASGWSLKDLAAKYGVGATGISYIVNHGKR